MLARGPISRGARALNVGWAVLLALAAPVGVGAQDLNVQHSIAFIEARLDGPLDVLNMTQARPLIPGDRSARVILAGAEGEAPIMAKWKPVHPPGDGFNNEPRYELAAYRLQQLFLAESEYVVPPTVLRAEPLDEYQGLRSESSPTIRGTSSVLFLLSYWVQSVTNRDPFDDERFEQDTVYARHWGNLNILTHLIDHKDANIGNILVSIDSANPRVFAVDNDVAFRSRVSDQGADWRRLHVDRLPHATIERLRALSRAQLDRALGVVAEFEIRDGQLHPVALGENLRPDRGLRRTETRVQFGLTTREIQAVERRIERLLEQVDRGSIETFPGPISPMM